MQGSVLDVLKTLKGDLRTLIQEEFLLLKTELSEKAAPVGRNAFACVIGGGATLAGGLVLLVALGFLLAWAFELAGLSQDLAGFVGFGIVGVIVAAAGA